MLDEELAAIALANKDKILARNKKIVRDNLAILDEWVKNEKHISYVKPQAGTVTLLYYDFDRPSRELCIDLIDNHDCSSLQETASSLNIAYELAMPVKQKN